MKMVLYLRAEAGTRPCDVGAQHDGSLRLLLKRLDSRQSSVLIAWLHNCRRVVTRWERHIENYVGMLQLACARALLRTSKR